MAHVICEPCVGVKSGECVQVCPVDCIHDAGDQLLINPEECIDCGACARVCPTTACFYIDEVPEAWISYIEKNAAFYRR
ncbi:MAG: indolepyruvate ferredoxin oxidoreductase subunit alpha [Armatimonadota bacterium]